MRQARGVLFGTACAVAAAGLSPWHGAEGYIGKDENAHVSVTPRVRLAPLKPCPSC
jgi:hypothetical protein